MTHHATWIVPAASRMSTAAAGTWRNAAATAVMSAGTAPASVAHQATGHGLDPAITRRLIADFVAAKPPTSVSPDVLTAREHEVLLALARGRTNAEIAAELFITEHTVKTHVANVLMKLDLRDRIHAVIHAYETGLVRPGW